MTPADAIAVAITPALHPRLRDRTKGHASECPVCHQARHVKDKRRIGKRCFDCAMRERWREPSGVAAKSESGRLLYRRQCVACGTATLVERRDRGNRCRPCAAAARATHGLSRTVGGEHPLYRVLKAAEARCKYPATKDYRWYGARGIRVCLEWSTDPAAFVRWAMANGYQRGLELDRIDNDGNYEPSNCRFVTHAENCRNKGHKK